MESLPPVACYVVNLVSRSDRLATIRSEFERVGWGDRLRVVEAKTPSSSEVQFLGEGLDLVTPHSWGSNRGLEIACLASHLEALRRIADGEETEGIVLEDDILLRREFREAYPECRRNFPKEAELVYLGCTIGANVPRLWSGVEPKKENIIARKDPIVWGCLMYWVTRSYARKLVHILGSRPLLQSMIFKTILTSELMSCFTIPYQTIPLLAIEDPINRSCLRENKEAPRDFLTWGWEYYGPVESWDWRAPLYRLSLEKLEPSDATRITERLGTLEGMEPDVLTGDGFLLWSTLLLRYTKIAKNKKSYQKTTAAILQRMKSDIYVNRPIREQLLATPDLVLSP